MRIVNFAEVSAKLVLHIRDLSGSLQLCRAASQGSSVLWKAPALAGTLPGTGLLIPALDEGVGDRHRDAESLSAGRPVRREVDRVAGRQAEVAHRELAVRYQHDEVVRLRE